MRPSTGERVPEFQENPSLGWLLRELNSNLRPANIVCESKMDTTEKHRPVFLVAPPRSGTTLFMQWLAASGSFAYPSNLLSRFYGAPLVGAQIQQLLLDPMYAFRDELFDLAAGTDFSSTNGKTRGALAPHEFWFFWRRFLHFQQLDYASDEDLRDKHDLPGLAKEINGLANVFNKPFALKGLILNQSIPTLAKEFDDPLFIWVKRDPLMTIQSILQARIRQFGHDREWYSFKIREHSELVGLRPVESVAGQVAALNKSIEAGLSSLPTGQRFTVSYEAFCENPQAVALELGQIMQTDMFSNTPNSSASLLPGAFRAETSWRVGEDPLEVRRLYQNHLERS